MENIVCNSGGAIGSDLFFENLCLQHNIKCNAYTYKTKYHNSISKVEISDDDYKEGIIKITNANKILKRSNINRYMNLLARNWSQVKYSEYIIAIGTIIKPKEKNIKGYINRCNIESIDGGTGYACMMGVLENKKVFVYDQNKKSWFKWSYVIEKFIKCDVPIINANFAGIGTRELSSDGELAIIDFFNKNFS